MPGRIKAVVAASSLLTASLAAVPAQAENTWACEVLLCASNPGGWMQFKECVPPIRKLITHLGLGGGFPTCSAGAVKKADYTKPKNGRPGYVEMTMNDGSRKTYTVPTSAQVDQAEGSAQPGPPPGAETLER